MSFTDPKAQELNMRGFFDPKSVDSVIRCIRNDHGDRLFRASQGSTDSVARELHALLMNRHGAIHYHNVPEILGHALRARDGLPESEHSSADLLISRLESCVEHIVQERRAARIAASEETSTTNPLKD